MIAAADSPRIRPGLRFIRKEESGKTVWVVKDPVNLKYFRFGDMEAWLMRHLDGSRTLAQIAETLRLERGVRTTADAISAFVRRLQELGLAERTQEQRAVLLMEALREGRRRRREGNTLLRMRFPLGDPDAFLDRLHARTGFLFTRAFFASAVVLVAAYVYIFATHWSALRAGTSLLFGPDPATLAQVYIVFTVICLVHELAHGLACKHYGGEVHEIGVMLLYFLPAFFCNINDAWTFERRSHRLWVTFAGGISDLFIASMSAVLWIATEPGTTVHQLAFITAAIAGGTGLLVNYNPLMPLDGYYALMDTLEIPNLRARASEYFGASLGRRVLHLDVRLPAVTPREHGIFLLYGAGSLAYSAFLLGLIGFLATRAALGAFGGWGWALVALAALSLAARWRGRARSLFAAWHPAHAGPWRRRSLGAAVAFVVVALAMFAPWTVHVRAPATVEPVRRAWLRPPVDGWVEDVPVAENATVRVGQVVAVLRSPPLELDYARARADVAALVAQAARARATGWPDTARAAEIALVARREALRAIEERRGQLLLRAPFDGQIATPRLRERIGQRVPRGDSLVEIWEPAPLRARIRIPQRDAGALRPGDRLGIRFPVHPSVTWRTRVASVAQMATGGEVEALAPLGLAPTGAALRPGMSGLASVAVIRTTIGGALLRAFRHRVRLDWLL